VKEFAAKEHVIDERVDRAELIDVLQEPVMLRNGWKHILKHCKQR